jgi:hypothetical protein
MTKFRTIRQAGDPFGQRSHGYRPYIESPDARPHKETTYAVL